MISHALDPPPATTIAETTATAAPTIAVTRHGQRSEFLKVPFSGADRRLWGCGHEAQTLGPWPFWGIILGFDSRVPLGAVFLPPGKMSPFGKLSRYMDDRSCHLFISMANSLRGFFRGSGPTEAVERHFPARVWLCEHFLDSPHRVLVSVRSASLGVEMPSRVATPICWPGAQSTPCGFILDIISWMGGLRVSGNAAFSQY